MNTEIKITYPRPKVTRLQLQKMLQENFNDPLLKEYLALYLTPPHPPKRCRNLIEWLGKHTASKTCANGADLIIVTAEKLLATNGASVAVSAHSGDFGGINAIDSKALLPSAIDSQMLEPFKRHIEGVVTELESLKAVETFKLRECKPKMLKGKTLLTYDLKGNFVEDSIAFGFDEIKSLLNTLDYWDAEIEVLAKDEGIVDLNQKPIYSTYCVKGSSQFGDFYLTLHDALPLTRVTKL